MSRIVLGSNSRVVQGITPARNGNGPVARNIQHSFQFYSKENCSAESTASFTATSSDRRASMRPADASATSISVASTVGNASTRSSDNVSYLTRSLSTSQVGRSKSNSVSKSSTDNPALLPFSPHYPPSSSTASAQPSEKKPKKETSNGSMAKSPSRLPPHSHTRTKKQIHDAKSGTQNPKTDSFLPPHPPLHIPPPPAPSFLAPRTRAVTRSLGIKTDTTSASSSPLSTSLAPPPKKQKPNPKSVLNASYPLPLQKKAACAVKSKNKPLPHPPHSPLSPSPVVNNSKGSKCSKGSKRSASPRPSCAPSKKQRTSYINHSGYSKSNASSLPLAPIQPKQNAVTSSRLKGDSILLQLPSSSVEQPKQKEPDGSKTRQARSVSAKNGSKTRNTVALSPPSLSKARSPSQSPSRSPFSKIRRNSPCVETVARVNPYTYTEPLKASPPPSVSKPKSNTSFCSSNFSMGSNKSRTALADIFNTYLNRGGQQRTFNLSGASKPRKRKRNQKPSSASPPISDSDLNAILDSMPLDMSLMSAKSNASTIASRRKYTKACMSMDMSWDHSPKRKNATSADQSKVAATKKKTVLASARTKKGPNGLSNLHIANFEITESDFENTTILAQLTKSKAAKGGGARKKNNKGMASIEEDVRKSKAKETRPKPQAIRMKRAVLPPQGTKKRRLIDDIYEPEVTPEPEPPLKKVSKATKTKPSKQSTSHNIDKVNKTKKLSSGTFLQKSFNTSKPQGKTGRRPRTYKIDFDDHEDTDEEELPKKVADWSSHSKETVEPRTRKQPRRVTSYIKTYCDGSITDGYMSDSSDLEDDVQGGGDSEAHCDAGMPSVSAYIRLSTQRKVSPSYSPSPVAPPPSPPPSPPLSGHSPLRLSTSPAPPLHVPYLSPSPMSSQENPSPSPKIAPSPYAAEQINPNDTILQGFEDVCRQLVARSKSKRVSEHSLCLPKTSSDQRTPVKGNGDDSGSRLDDDGCDSHVTLTQLSRVCLKSALLKRVL